MLPEHLTLNHEEMLGHISQVNDYANQNCSGNKIPNAIEEISYSKENTCSNLVASYDRSLSVSKSNLHNDDSAINPCNDLSQNMISETH